MRPIGRNRALAREGETRGSIARLLLGYTLLFCAFYAAVLSPYFFYGKAFLTGTDGLTVHIPALRLSRQWLESLLQSVQRGAFEVPQWSLSVGFGQPLLVNVVSLRLSNLLYALFPEGAMELWLLIRTTICMYLTGLSFIAYARTRTRDAAGLLLGGLMYAFCGFALVVAARHTFFLGMTIALPLMLLGVDRIFDGRWSWTFILSVAMLGLSSAYLLFMVTVPAVIYAAFHYFELAPKARGARGGLARIFLRHVAQYLCGIALCAVYFLPTVVTILSSSRAGMQGGLSLLAWDADIYLGLIFAVVDMDRISFFGYIALPSAALVGVVWLFRARKRRVRLIRGQVALYALAFFIPLLTLVFNGFAGKLMRWCFIFSFWASLAAAVALPALRSDDGEDAAFCLRALCGYLLLYIAAGIWTGRPFSFVAGLACVGVAALFGAMRLYRAGRRRAATALLFAMLLVELTARSYQLNDPQFDNTITGAYNAGAVLDVAADNPAGALQLADDDGLYRTDVLMPNRARQNAQTNYGARCGVNGVSSFYSYTDARTIAAMTALANARHDTKFHIMSLDQRTVLNELAGVKYLTAFESGDDHLPYGYELVDSREKTLSTGRTMTECLYRNTYALPLSYAYTAQIAPQAYDALPAHRREQAMLQGVVIEGDADLATIEPEFDDFAILDGDALSAAIAQAAADDADLEYADGVLRVMKDDAKITIPIERTSGEIYLSLTGAAYRSVNFEAESAAALARDDAKPLALMNAYREARMWQGGTTAYITATSGSLSGDGTLLDPRHQYYFGKRDILINLGYGRTGKKLTLRFSAAGEYRFDGIELIAQPMERNAEKVAPLIENQASSVEVDGNRVTIEYDLDHSAFACVAIPYDAGWRATVDGAKADILPANGMYMGVMLDAGRHTIELRYSMPGLRLGALISLLALIVVPIIGIVYGVRRKRARGAVRKP